MRKEHTYQLLCCSTNTNSTFKELYESTYLTLYRVAWNILNNHHLVEDTLQDAYIKIWLKAKTFDHNKKRTVLVWMSVITRNTALDKLRSLKKNSYVENNNSVYELDDLSSLELLPDALLGYYEETKNYLSSIKDLKPQQIICLVFFYFYGHSHEQLSKQLNIPLGTVKSWIRRTPIAS